MIINNKENFSLYKVNSGQLHNLNDENFQAKLFSWNNSEITLSQPNTSYFGFVSSGSAIIQNSSGKFMLSKGMYFSSPDNISIEGSGKGILIEQNECQSFFSIGGPIENMGRLQYIDGCTDSLLIAPTVLGEPCLNLLHIPKGTNQTSHTHPSFRTGIIVKGKGYCTTESGEFPLAPGDIFVIPKNCLHRFRTEEEALLVIAYHPDSDFGPTHQNHPMINKTMI